VKAGKAMSSERKRWQAKGKALPVETVMIATQTDAIPAEVKTIQVEEGAQTEVGITELEKAMKKKRGERKGGSQGQRRYSYEGQVRRL